MHCTRYCLLCFSSSDNQWCDGYFSLYKESSPKGELIAEGTCMSQKKNWQNNKTGLIKLTKAKISRIYDIKLPSGYSLSFKSEKIMFWTILFECKARFKHISLVVNKGIHCCASEFNKNTIVLFINEIKIWHFLINFLLSHL